MSEYYEVTPISKDSKSFKFRTDNNLTYNVFFNPDDQLNIISNERINNIYQLSLEKIENEIEPYDKKISKTVEHVIFNEFFNNKDNILLYVSSDDDKRAKLRNRTFDRWYQRSKYKENIRKVDNLVKYKEEGQPDLEIHTAILFHLENNNAQKLISVFKSAEEELNRDK